MTKQQPTKRQIMFEKYFLIKLCYNRALSYTGLPMGIFSQVAIIGTFLRVFNLVEPMVVYMGAGIYIISMFILGYIDIKHGIIKEENSFNNRYNPELKHLVKRAGGKVEK